MIVLLNSRKNWKPDSPVEVNDITPEKEKAHQLYKEGKSYREIARIIGKSDKTIKKWIEEYEEYCAKHEANEEVENDFFEVDSAEMRSAE